MNNTDVPIWEKYTLTVEEASKYFRIVEKVENGRVYTIEGNSGDSVRQNSYPVGHYEVLGYGCPDF